MIRTTKRPIEHTMAAIALLVLGACGEESSPLRVVPVEPAASRIMAGADQAGTVAERTPESLAVLVTDRFDNPVPEVEVAFAVGAGSGSVEPAVARTGLDGIARATWTLGTTAGPQTATATVRGLDPVVFSARAEPGPPTSVRRISGDGQAATVGEPLAAPLVVEVVDAYGNPIAGTNVSWLVEEGGGSVSPSSETTDANGRAQAVWTLGTRAGEQRVTASANQSIFTVFTAAAAPGPPAAASPASGDGQAGPAGLQLEQPLVVKVADAHGNGIAGIAVEWEVTAGGGWVDPATSITDAAGTASTRLTLGLTPGPNSVTARPAGLPPVVFSATALDPMDLSIAGVYLVQSTQTLARDVPLVAGRDAYLRVFVVATEARSVQPDVYVEFFDGTTLIASDTIPAPSASVPTAMDEGAFSSSWNLRVPGAMIAPGLGIRVTVDPNDDVPEGDDSNNTFPSAGAVLPLDVRSLPPFQVYFVPVRIMGASTVTGNVNDGNAGSYLVNALKVFPLPGANAAVRSEPFTSSVTTTSTDSAWQTIISEIRALRTADGRQEYYYGVLPIAGTSPYCGLGYVGFPVAIGLDACGAWTAAHEWGHNFGRLHVDCGDPANPDPAYPYPNGSIGVYGLDVATGEITRPTTHVDLMSYCSPEWISDYTFRAVLQFRENEAAARPAYAAAREPALVVWGRMDGRTLVLEPAFEAETRPALPAAPGPYTLQGLDAAGGVLFELSFAGEAPGHGPRDARHFAFALPASLAQPQRLARLRLTGPGAPAAERARTLAQARVSPAPMAEAVASGDVRVRWNAAAFPLAVVRDPGTGEILSFARSGTALVRSSAAELELVFSDGVGSTRRRVAVQR
ncbi:MAG TPA: Ig-like domain-containing protein [Longimicrobiales bacterium]